MALATLIAALALHSYGSRHIIAEEFALGSENFHSHERWRGAQFTASSPKEIAKLLRSVEEQPSSAKTTKVLWLGNSQLHAINQFRSGDHLAPFWLRKNASCPDCLIPLGVSLPNANLQEFLVLYHAFTQRTSIDAVVLAAVFDDLREDGIRSDLDALITDDVRVRMRQSSVGRDIIDRSFRSEHGNGSTTNPGLEGFVQKAFEDLLTDHLAGIWPLWAKRPELRAHVVTDLYHLRNYALGIKATTVRPMITPRLERNMLALAALLEHAQARRTPVAIYIAPIRQDFPLPYLMDQYAAWKTEISGVASRYGATVHNLESLVPPEHWGTQRADEIDFMHFQGTGHRLLADALGPIVANMVAKER